MTVISLHREPLQRELSPLEQLDAFLNTCILRARNDAEMRMWWDRKIFIKRQLARLRPDTVQQRAADVLASLIAEAA